MKKEEAKSKGLRKMGKIKSLKIVQMGLRCPVKVMIINWSIVLMI